MTSTSIDMDQSTTRLARSGSDRARAVAHLRRVVRADSVLCSVSGLVLAAGGGPFADLAGLGSVWSVRAAGVFLVMLAVALWLLADTSARRLVALTPWSAKGDIVWALASLAVAFETSLTGPGRALVAAQAVVVASVGAAKLRAVRAVSP